MADVQKEHGFTAISNQILENIFQYHFTKIDLAVIFITLRFTYGYQRKQSGISLNQFTKFIKTDRANISRSIQRLIDANVIKVIAEKSGMRPRIISFNKDYDEWDQSKLCAERSALQFDATDEKSSIIISKDGLLKIDEQEDKVLLNIQHPVLSNEQHQKLSSTQHKVLSGEQPINKKEKKMKDNSSSNSNICYLISPKEMDRKADSATAAKIINDLEKRLTSLFLSCFNQYPNIYELDILKKEILQDDRLEIIEIIRIVQESFHKVATYDIRKRNTNYVIGVIKSMKQELFLKKETAKKNEEKQLAAQAKKQDEYVPGTIMKAYYENMAKGIKEEKDKQNKQQ